MRRVAMRRDPWVPLADVNLVALADGSDTDLGVSNGSKSIAGVNWTLATQAGMLATGAGAPSGLYLGGAASEGLRFGLGATSSTTDHDDADLGTPGGPVLYTTMANLVGTTLWPSASQLAAKQVKSAIAIGCIVDASALAQNRMSAGIVLSDANTFARGVAYGVSYTTVANALWSREEATFGSPYEVPLSTWSGMSRSNVCIIIVAHSNGTHAYYAMSPDGISYPRTGWFSSVYATIGHSSLASGLGDIVCHTTVAGLFVANSSGAGSGTEVDFKRFSVWSLEDDMTPTFGRGALTVTNP